MFRSEQERQTCAALAEAADFDPTSKRPVLFQIAIGMPTADRALAEDRVNALPDEKSRELALRELSQCFSLALTFDDAFDVKAYLHEIRERRISRELMQFALRYAVEAKNGIVNGSDFNDAAERDFATIVGRRAKARANEAQDAADVVSETMHDLTQNQRSEDYVCGTGIASIDHFFGSLERKQLFVIAGRPSMGKSALGHQMARHAALEGHRVLVYSFEMNSKEVMRRHVAALSGIDIRALKSRQLSREQWARAMECAATLSTMNMKTIQRSDTPGRTVEEVKASMKREFDASPPAIVLLDHLHITHTKRRVNSEDERFGFIAETMKQLAEEMNVCVIMVAAMNRQADNRSDHRPQMSDMRGSGMIEYHANNILGLWRPEMYDHEDAALRGKAEGIVMKQRDGETGIATMMFNGPCTSFSAELKAV